MKVIENLNELHIAQLHEYYQAEWWSKGRTWEETCLCVTNSSITIGIVNDQDDLIGFARVLTDGIFKAFVFDVIIDNDYRGQGLGELIVRTIKHHSKLRRVQHFELYCKPDMVPFYEKYGFDTNVGDIHLMRFTPTN